MNQHITLQYAEAQHFFSIRNYSIAITASLLLSLATGALGQTHDSHSSGMSHSTEPMVLPSEVGQSAFAAIAQVVAIIESDPAVNWSMVDIDALRTHLVDMDRLTMSAKIATTELDGQAIQFLVTGEGRTLQAIHAMVPTHAQTVREFTNWIVKVDEISDGVILTITPGPDGALSKIRALGFFGFMTLGAHHPLHHLQIAMGGGH